jgi:hypothetical protein
MLIFKFKQESKMDIEFVRKAKQELENSILLATTEALAKFYNETGESPYCINIELFDVRKLGEVKHKYVAHNVTSVIYL